MEFTSMEFVETPVFTKLVLEHNLEEPLRSLQVELIQNPMSGRLDPNTGGLRKIRVPDPSRNKGKRGGVRVVYFNRFANGEICLILIYAKSARDNVPANVLKQLKQEIENAHD